MDPEIDSYDDFMLEELQDELEKRKKIYKFDKYDDENNEMMQEITDILNSRMKKKRPPPPIPPPVKKMSSGLDVLYRAQFVISVESDDRVSIIKNRYQTIPQKMAFDLIGTIMANTIFGIEEQPLMKLFSEGIKVEIVQKCNEILKSHGILKDV